MGGLGHFIEAEGIATTQISLIREHTEIIKPPRALWVSFPLGRPLGNPNDPQFQKKVLRHALSLIEYGEGPVLEDFPEDALENDGEPPQVACPVSFGKPVAEKNSIAGLLQNFRHELDLMQTWYEFAQQKNGRTTVGTSGLSLDGIAELFQEVIEWKTFEAGVSDFSPADLLRLAAEELKAYYFEGLLAQPGQTSSSVVLANWFWGETYAAKIINEVRKVCLRSSDKAMILNGKLLLVPRNQLHRFDE